MASAQRGARSYGRVRCHGLAMPSSRTRKQACQDSLKGARVLHAILPTFHEHTKGLARSK